MILDTIGNIDRYAGRYPEIAEGISFLKRADLAALPEGRHDISGDEAYGLIRSYTTEPVTQDDACEAHRRYLDIQMIVSGRETLYHHDIEGLCLKQGYQEENDCTLYEIGTAKAIPLEAGDFVILFPWDAHLPKKAANGQAAAVRKAVVKIAVKGM